MDSKYIEAYEAILTAEKEIAIAKRELTRGDSPYVSLSVARNQCDRAMSLWHATKEKELNED